MNVKNFIKNLIFHGKNTHANLLDTNIGKFAERCFGAEFIKYCEIHTTDIGLIEPKTISIKNTNIRLYWAKNSNCFWLYGHLNLDGEIVKYGDKTNINDINSLSYALIRFEKFIIYV